MFINRVSPSKIKVYKDCKLKYKLKYIDRLPDDYNDSTNTDALQFGTYIHEIFEHGSELETLEELKDLAKDLRDKYKFGKEKEKLIDESVENFFNWNKALTAETVGKELVFGVEHKSYELNGIIDRVLRSPEGKYLVIDYKTSKRPLTKRQLYTDDQLIMYAAAISKLYDVSPSNITLGHYYPHLDKFVSIVYPASVVNGYLNNSLDRKIWDIRKRKKHQFPAEKNKFCDWCGYRDICPAFTGNKSLLEEAIANHKSKDNKE